MSRPTKTYEKELRLVKSMKAGMAWFIPADHPKGLMAKVYETLLNRGDRASFRVQITYMFGTTGVTVIRDPKILIPSEGDYRDAKD